MLPNGIVEKAYLLAIKYHDGQLRKDGLPYLIHPLSVSAILLKNNFSDEVVAAGLCHDLLEDTLCSEEEIAQNCGESVLNLVKAVTDEKHLQHKDRWEERKNSQIEKVRIASADIKAIYTADKIHNLRSILEQHKVEGTNTWNHFSRGKDIRIQYDRAILQMLRETWDHKLLEEFGELIMLEESLES